MRYFTLYLSDSSDPDADILR